MCPSILKRTAVAIASAGACSTGSPSALAATACQLAAPTVVMCQTPKNAALAYQAFGKDIGKMRVDYNRQIIHESWCALVSDPARSLAVEEYSRGRIATPNGWVNVLQVGFKHDGMTDIRYVAAAYIRGNCLKYSYNADKASEESQAARSPYLPSLPPGGYKVPSDGGRP